MVKGGGGEMGGFGGGQLEHLRQRLGAQWAGLNPGSAEPPRASRRALRSQGRHSRMTRIVFSTLECSLRCLTAWHQSAWKERERERDELTEPQGRLRLVGHVYSPRGTSEPPTTTSGPSGEILGLAWKEKMPSVRSVLGKPWRTRAARAGVAAAAANLEEDGLLGDGVLAVSLSKARLRVSLGFEPSVAYEEDEVAERLPRLCEGIPG
eukprot:scaffold36343_cov60-Phaeocystis_antarctica.AAC.5